MSNSAIPWTVCSTPGSSVLHYLLEFIESVMLSNHLILCCRLLLLPSIFPSSTVFPDESALQIRWSKYWSFRFSASPSNKYSGLISFRTDWFDLLEVQGTLKSLLQHRNSKASILQCSAFKSSRLPGEISITLDMQIIPHLRQKVKKN